MSNLRHTLLKPLPALFAAAAFLAPVTAMANAPPQPTLSKWAPPWVGFLFMGVLLALVLGVSLMPSKRGHQD